MAVTGRFSHAQPLQSQGFFLLFSRNRLAIALENFHAFESGKEFNEQLELVALQGPFRVNAVTIGCSIEIQLPSEYLPLNN